MYNKILIPVDKEEASSWAAEQGMDLARRLGAEVLLANVAAPRVPGLLLPPPPGGFGSQPDFYPEAKDVEDILFRLKAQGENMGLQVRITIALGDPATELLTLAELEKVDLILMAAHGRGRLGSALLGSVSQGIISGAPCPVQVIGETARRRMQRQPVAALAGSTAATPDQELDPEC